MRRVVAGGVLAGAFAWGQKPTMLVEPPVPLLHAQAGGLTTAAVLQKSAAEMGDVRFDEPGCEPAMGDAATVGAGGSQMCWPVLKEDGLTRVAVADYGKVRVSALQFVDATGAYSAYTFYRSMMRSPHLVGADARLKPGTSETSADAGGTLVWAGTVVLKLNGPVSKQELAVLVSPLPKVGGSKGLAPLLPSELVTSGLDPASIRYALGPVAYQAMGGVLPAGILGWDKSAEVATANYSGKGWSHGVLTVLIYPTPQIAGDRGRAIEKAVNDEGVEKFGTLRMRRVGPLVGVASGAWTVKQAEDTMAALKLDQEVTFDKKKPLEFHAEIKKTASLLQNIAVLIGVLVTAAILLGLFLGFGRAGLRKLQGKPAYVEPEFLSISLRDKPKALFVRKEE